MVSIIKKVLIISAGIFTAIAASGCYGGNKRADVKNAISTVSEQFGADFKLKSKKFTGGTMCNVIVTCSETGDKEISVFQFDEKHPVYTDYMFVRYGDDAYSAIQKAAEKAETECKVVVIDLAVNHYPNAAYDSSSDLKTYLANNDFEIKVYIPHKLDKEGLIAEYKKLALSLRDSGINCHTLVLECCETKADLDAMTPPDHIPHKREDYDSGVSEAFNTSISSVYRSLAEYCEDPDDLKDVLIIVDGVTVKKI